MKDEKKNCDEKKTVLDEIRERVDRAYTQGFDSGIKSIKHLELLYDQLSNRSVGIDLHIGELEKKVDEWKDYMVKVRKIQQQETSEIVELRENIEHFDEHICDNVVEPIRASLQNQLNELKEAMLK